MLSCHLISTLSSVRTGFSKQWDDQNC